MAFALSRRVRRVAIGGTAMLVLTGLAACDYGPDGDPDVVTAVGSDTTQDVMEAIFADYAASTYNDNPDIPGDDEDTLVNVLSQGTESSGADEHCIGINWAPANPAGPYADCASSANRRTPNGSTEGRDALRDQPGAVDIARSSSGPRATPTPDPVSFEYYAYGLDAVGWSSASALAPANLTQAQLQGIYNCTFTNWNQVGGGNGAIERYWPQAGSGTRAFAQSDLLGFDPTTISGAGCPAVVLTQENSGQTIAANGDQATAVVPYSGANWIAAANGVTSPDQRAGQTVRSLNGQNITSFNGTKWVPGAPVVENNVRLFNPSTTYPGIRYVFNVIDSADPSYIDAQRYVGFDNVDKGATSPLCSGGKNTILNNFGFGALGATVLNPTNLAGSTCRLY